MFRLCVAALVTSVVFLSFSVTAAGDDLAGAPVRIDFNDVVNTNGTRAQSHSLLKIAVAAMISPKNTYKYYAELLRLIGERMDLQVMFIQKKTYSEVNEMLKENKLDLAFVCSGPYVSGRDDFGMEILAVPVCHGEKVYYSYFITSKKSGIRSFDDLRGKTFAFTDPLSNTGYAVPVYYLAKRNETPEFYFKKTFFTYSHDNSIRAVANGLADGAAVDSLIFDFMHVKNPELTAKTMVVDRSPPYGIPPVVVTPSMDPGMKENLKKVFFTIHQDPKGKQLLESLQIDRFEQGDDSDYNTIRELQDFLKSKQQ